jgi:pentapeptide MXKDX repeat protein
VKITSPVCYLPSAAHHQNCKVLVPVGCGSVSVSAEQNNTSETAGAERDDKARYDTTRCDTMQYVTIRYDTTRCDTMQNDAIRCDTMRYDAIRCDTMRYDAIRCDTMRYDAIRCDTMRYDTTIRRCVQCTLVSSYLQPARLGTVGTVPTQHELAMTMPIRMWRHRCHCHTLHVNANNQSRP